MSTSSTNLLEEMDNIVEDKDVLFTSVFQHLDEIAHTASSSSSSSPPSNHQQQQPPSSAAAATPTTTQQLLDPDLLLRATRSLDTSTPSNILWRLLSQGEHLLQTLTNQDPTPLTRLLSQVINLLPFSELRSVIEVNKLIEGLTSGVVPVKLLCLAYLGRAGDSPSGAGFVASEEELVRCLVEVWLGTGDTEVAERCLEVLVGLLSVDLPGVVTFVGGGGGGGGQAEGQGLMWRRMFHDVEIYKLLFMWTSLVRSECHDLNTKKGLHAATISQGRLFDFVAQVAALDWVAVTTTTFPDVEREYSNDGEQQQQQQQQPYGGLLKYVANGMIDSNDYLMEVLRQDFFGKLLLVLENNANRRGVSQRLIAAIQEGAGVQQQEVETNGVNGMHL